MNHVGFMAPCTRCGAWRTYLEGFYILYHVGYRTKGPALAMNPTWFMASSDRPPLVISLTVE